MASRDTFTDRLVEAIREKKSVLCVGLDPQLHLIPEQLRRQAREQYGAGFKGVAHAFLAFNSSIIDAVSPFAVAVKPNSAFYERYGSDGIFALEETIKYANRKGLLVITDAKRGDGGDTADAYADTYLGEVPFWGVDEEQAWTPSPLRSDALTIHGYIGEACVKSFVRQILAYGTGAFVVDKTSFKPNSVIEQMVTKSADEPDSPVPQHGLPVWQELALLVAEWGKGTEGRHGYRNLGVVMAGTYKEDTPYMRKILPANRYWLLVPGFGKQGGDADGAVVGADERGLGILVNSSRAITFAYADEKGPFHTAPEHYLDAATRAAQTSVHDLNNALRRAGKLGF